MEPSGPAPAALKYRERGVAEAVGGREIGQRPLDGQLRLPYGLIGRCGVVFGDRHLLGNAVGRAGAGKDETRYAVPPA